MYTYKYVHTIYVYVDELDETDIYDIALRCLILKKSFATEKRW